MKEKDEFEEFADWVTSHMGSVWKKTWKENDNALFELTLKSWNVNPFQLILDYFTEKDQRPAYSSDLYLPKLANCGIYYAVDNKGNWHYIDSDGQWNSMPSLVAYWKTEGRKELLAELEADERLEGDCICDECMEEEKEDFEAHVREIVIDAFETNKDNIRNIVCGK